MRQLDASMKLLVRAAVAGAAALSLVGCVSSGVALSDVSPTPQSDASNPALICPVLTEGQIEQLGDAYPAGLITDQYGEYCKLTINAASKALQHDPATIDRTVQEYGFTDEEAFAAQDAAVRWIVENFLDSAILDVTPPEGMTPDEWTREHGGINLREWENENYEVHIWAGAPALNGFSTPFERSGLPRAVSISISDVRITVFQALGSEKPTLLVSVQASATYNAKDVQVSEFLENYMATVMNEELLNDGVDGVFEIRFDHVRVGYLGDISSGLTGFNFVFNSFLDGTQIAE